MEPLLNQTNFNSPTRKGGPESPCTRNGCADSIPIVSRNHVECSTPVDKHVKDSTPLFNTNNSIANTVSNDTNNSKANTDPPNLSDTYATWCHIGGLLRSDASVGSSMLNPLTQVQMLQKDRSLRPVTIQPPLFGNRS